MSGFNDLVAKAQPALAGGGCNASGTEGRTWEWTFSDIVDNSGTPVDMNTGITGTCKVFDGSSTVITLTYTGGTGTFTISATKAATANLAGTKDRRKCRWGLSLDNGTKSIEVWAPSSSAFLILNEDGVAS